MHCIAYWYCLLAPVILVWNNTPCYSKWACHVIPKTHLLLVGLVLAWGAKGLGPGWLGFGLGGNLGGGGGERGNFMYSYHNFSLVNQKRILDIFVHTNFSRRVFWERRDK